MFIWTQFTSSGRTKVQEDVSRVSFYFGSDNVGVQADPNIYRIHQKKTIYGYGRGRFCLRKRETGGEMNLTVSFEDGGTLSLISGKVSEGSD